MFKYKLLGLLLILSLVGCTQAPSNTDMQDVISAITDQNVRKAFGGVRCIDVQYKKFDVLNSFTKTVNDEVRYNVKVHWVGDLTLQNPFTGEKVAANNREFTVRYSFTKKGNEWFGKEGW